MTAQGKPDRCPTCSSASMEYRTFPYCHNSWHDSSPVPAAAPQAHIARCVCRGTPSVRHGICMRCRLPRRSTPHLPTQDLTTLAEKAAEKVSKFDMNFMEELTNPDNSPSLDVDSDVRIPSLRPNSKGFITKTPSAPQAESVPSGKDAAHKWLDAKVGRPFSERHEFTDHNGRTWNVATLLSEYAAALAAERDKSRQNHVLFQEQMIEALGLDTGRIWFGAGVIAAAKAKANLVAELERSNSLLRGRLTAAEGLLKIISDPPHDCCGCDDHSKANADCCAYVNYHCPECIAGAYFEKENQ